MYNSVEDKRHLTTGGGGGWGEKGTVSMVKKGTILEEENHRIVRPSVGSDAVVLSVVITHTLPANDELNLAFGTRRSFRYLAAHQQSAIPGSDQSFTRPMFHALTACDTASSFAGHSNMTA